MNTKHLAELSDERIAKAFANMAGNQDAGIVMARYSERIDALIAANEALTKENAELRADAERWRKYKARKDAVIAAHMGRNPLRHDEAIDAAIAARSATP